MILVSACLAGQNCRYDGKATPTPWVTALVQQGQAHPVCPEQLGGLSTPRIPCEIQPDGRVQSQEGQDFTEAFTLGAQRTLNIAQALGAQQAILKAKSPSCGCGQIYSGAFDNALVAGDGFTASLLKANGLKIYNENQAFDFYKAYDVIWFDLDDTLMDFKKTQRDAFEGLCQALGFMDPKAWTGLNQLYEQFNHPLWKQLEAGTIGMDFLRFSRIHQFLMAIEEQSLWPKARTAAQIALAKDTQAVADHYEALLGRGDTLLDGAQSLIAGLSAHYRIGLITNGIGHVQRARLSQSPITPYLEAVVISELAGASKPAKAIFEHTAEVMAVKPSDRILMVGDSLISDIAGGNGYGTDTCWYNPKRRPNIATSAAASATATASASAQTPTMEISSLDQLAELLLPNPFIGITGYSQLLKALNAKGHGFQQGDNPVLTLMRIDGYCGSGKSTLGQHLTRLLGAQLVSMDHFFVPEPLKTPERQAKPGHNVHWERFLLEVLQPLREGRPAAYRPYRCADDTYGDFITIKAEGLVIIEGSYSGHPELDSSYDLRIFMKTSEKNQLQRIGERSGHVVLERFMRLWIPYEKAYFEAFPIEGDSDIVIET